MAHITVSQGAADGSVDVGEGDARRVVTVISTVGAAVTVPKVSAAALSPAPTAARRPSR